MVVLLERIELSTSSLPRQGKVSGKASNSASLSTKPAGDLPTTHAIPKP